LSGRLGAAKGKQWRTAAVAVVLLGLLWGAATAGPAADLGSFVAGPVGWIGWTAGAATGIGLAAVALGVVSVRRFTTRTPRDAAPLPPVSVLRPLCGDEPGLDAALASLCEQRYPAFQIVFGVRNAADPALRAVHRLQALYPDLDIEAVADPAMHGPNRKISNLINMLPFARHDTLVFSDSDLHVAPDYLERLMSALAAPATGLVTTLCTGRPTAPGLAARLGAMQITHCFLPGALLSRALGRQDCLGTTMALRRDTLARAGGLHALVGHLADDNVLGQLVQRLGLRVELADTVPATGVPETSLPALWQHELRWARTIGALEPAAFAASALQFPLAWAGLAWLCSGGAAWSTGLVALAWLARASAAGAVTRMLARHAGGADERWSSMWVTAGLLPIRDVLSVGQIAASYLGRKVLWRGYLMAVDNGLAAHLAPMPYAIRRDGADFTAPAVLAAGTMRSPAGR